MKPRTRTFGAGRPARDWRFSQGDPSNVFNGGSNAWGYRGWVMTGVSLYGTGPNGINQWIAPASWASWAGTPQSTWRPGRLITWGNAGSLHGAGCQVTMADGSVRYINEGTDINILQYLGYIADGVSVGANF